MRVRNGGEMETVCNWKTDLTSNVAALTTVHAAGMFKPTLQLKMYNIIIVCRKKPLTSWTASTLLLTSSRNRQTNFVQSSLDTEKEAIWKDDAANMREFSSCNRDAIDR